MGSKSVMITFQLISQAILSCNLTAKHRKSAQNPPLKQAFFKRG